MQLIVNEISIGPLRVRTSSILYSFRKNLVSKSDSRVLKSENRSSGRDLVYNNNITYLKTKRETFGGDSPRL